MRLRLSFLAIIVIAALILLTVQAVENAGASALTAFGLSVWTADGSSMSTADGANAVLANPGAIGLRKGFGTFYGATVENERQTSYAFSFQLGNMAIGYKHLNAMPLQPEGSSFLMGLGVPLSQSLGIGFFGDWQSLEDESDSRAFSYGTALLMRPCRHFSLGAKLSNINQPRLGEELLSRFYEIGVGVRPLGNRLTLTVDTDLCEGERFADRPLRYGVEMEPLNGLLLHAAYAEKDGQGDVRFSVGFAFPRASVGYSGENRESGNDRTSYYVSATSELQRSTVRPGGKVIKLDVEGNLRDQGSEGFFTLGGSYRSALPLLQELRSARKEEWVKGILLNVKGISNLAVIEEMRDEIKRSRAQGKKVVAFIDGDADFSEYYLAAAADKIVIPLAGTVGQLSIGRTVLLYKNFLGKMGIEFERFPCRNCAYKSAYANYTEDKLPEGYKKQIEEILGDMYDEWLANVSKDRGIDIERLRELADGRMIVATEAVEEGLIDAIGFYDYADSLVKEMAGAGVDDKLKLCRIDHRKYDWGTPRKIAVVLAMGGIMEGRNRSDFMEGNIMGHETMMEILSKVEKDRHVKSVVWRIDSPGGSGYASDAIWNAIEKVKKKKPVVSSMGMVAGSGGYWIAMNSNKIVADPLTITGSIGVTALKPVLSGTYDKLGINREVFKRGEHADMLSTARKLTEDEMDMMLDIVDQFYDYFIEKVSDGRGLKAEDVRKIGGGHVYTGRRALSIGLVDRLGGLEEAIEEAKKLAGLEGEVERSYYERPRNSIIGTILGLRAEQETQNFSPLRGYDGPALLMDDLPEVFEVEP